MALYILIAARSIKPTRTFIRWKRAPAGAAASAVDLPGDPRFRVRRLMV